VPLSVELLRPTVLVKILVAYAAIHELNVAHGDIRKENILVLRDGSVRILDFEMSYIVPENDRELIRAETDEVFVMLQDLRPDILEERDIYERTALDHAAFNRQAKAVEMLLKANAKTNVQDRCGRTALHQAALIGDLDIIRMLINAGADVSLNDTRGWTASVMAMTHGHLEAVKVLQQFAVSPNMILLQLAVESGNSENVKAALEHNKAVAEPGRTFLHVAEDPKIIKMLIDAGPDVDARDYKERTALHVAIEMQREEIVQVLIDAGVGVHAKDIHGRTALHVATREKQTEIVKILVGAGADVNAQDNEGITLLHIAAEDEQSEIIQILTDAGADISAPNNEGRMVMQRKEVKEDAGT
jgi:ankyrin repeat protein